MASLQELLAQREKLDREIDLAKKQGRADAIAKVRSLMAEHGLTLADLGGSAKPAKPASGNAGKKAPVKYRNASTGDTWSGRGLKPKWLRAAIAAGRRIEDFAV